jgi:hypothetical protein
MYRSSKQREKSNALTRRQQDLLVDAEDDRVKYQHQVLLKEHQLDEEVKQDLKLYVTIRSRTRQDAFIYEFRNKKLIEIEENISMINEKFADIESNNESNDNTNSRNFSNSLNFSKSLKKLLTETYSENNVIKKIMKTK